MPTKAEGAAQKAIAMARFSHNTALWVLCLPCLAVLLSYGGLVSLIVLIFGAIVTYTADASDLREVTLVSVLATLLGVLVTLIVASRGMLGASGWNFLLLHQIVRPMHPSFNPYGALLLPSLQRKSTLPRPLLHSSAPLAAILPKSCLLSLFFSPTVLLRHSIAAPAPSVLKRCLPPPIQIVYVALVGLWAVLQFQWLAREIPDAAGKVLHPLLPSCCVRRLGLLSRDPTSHHARELLGSLNAHLLTHSAHSLHSYSRLTRSWHAVPPLPRARTLHSTCSSGCARFLPCYACSGSRASSLRLPPRS